MFQRPARPNGQPGHEYRAALPFEREAESMKGTWATARCMAATIVSDRRRRTNGFIRRADSGGTQNKLNPGWHHGVECAPENGQ